MAAMAATQIRLLFHPTDAVPQAVPGTRAPVRWIVALLSPGNSTVGALFCEKRALKSGMHCEICEDNSNDYERKCNGYCGRPAAVSPIILPAKAVFTSRTTIVRQPRLGHGIAYGVCQMLHHFGRGHNERRLNKPRSAIGGNPEESCSS